VPFAPWTMDQTIAAIGDLIRAGRPSHIIAANTHHVMLSDGDHDLRAINHGAAFIVADGMPLVWASRFGESALPERVAGSDRLFHFSAEAAVKGYRLFLMGGAEGVADEAAKRLTTLYPGLQVAGTACPPFRGWTADEEADLIARIRSAKIAVAFLQTSKGSRWSFLSCAADACMLGSCRLYRRKRIQRTALRRLEPHGTVSRQARGSQRQGLVHNVFAVCLATGGRFS
jgi:N-acetylglucosaminyldiphosphoundecaprenol N-acetyl-beta-D-mannosaminyltransferase